MTTNKETLFSIVVPVYNAEPFLRECLDSVLAQSIADWELICVDDGSTDQSLAILRDYAERDQRVKIHVQANLRAGAARSAGITLAKGNYILFLDADDAFKADAFSRIQAIMREGAPDFCMFLFDQIDEISGASSPFPAFPALLNPRTRFLDVSLDDHPDTLLHGTVVPWNKCYRRDFLRANHLRFEPLFCSEDRLFYFQCVALARKIRLCNESFVRHRVNGNPQSLSSQNGIKNLEANAIANQQIRDFFRAYPEPIRQTIADIRFNEIILCYEKGDGNSASALLSLARAYFREMDLSELRRPPEDYPWYAQYKLIMGSADFPTANNDEQSICPLILAVDKRGLNKLRATIANCKKSAAPNNATLCFVLFDRELTPDDQKSLERLSSADFVILCLSLRRQLETFKGQTRATLSQPRHFHLLCQRLIRQYGCFSSIDENGVRFSFSAEQNEATLSKLVRQREGALGFLDSFLVEARCAGLKSALYKTELRLYNHQNRSFARFIIRVIRLLRGEHGK